MEQAARLTQSPQPSVAPIVPERPTLAPNVQLVGEMQGTGFKDRQWLVQRDDQFIQVTELLYRVAEYTNGERTVEEIAAAVTEASEWVVSADNIRYLMQTKLMPMGLVTDAQGAAAVRRESPAGPLRMMLRKNVLSPRFIDPVTKILQYLYAPPLLIPTLVLIAASHWWLYFRHGIAGSVLDVLATPGLLLMVVGIIALSGIIHEFGHASALRYGGGKVRGMGMGLYLIYPAFYTDTTDSYRLGRWARVRTDLGGFYFHLLFALGMIGLYLLTGREFLLLVVLLINLDILYQLLPFVRFDGYWALADLTGIPDFFSQMGPFLASLVPGARGKASRLPDLKPWAKRVFLAYIFFTLPVLGVLLFLMIRRVPSIMLVIGAALAAQTTAFRAALNTGSVLGLLAALAQMLILALPFVGIVYMLYQTLSRLIRSLWGWSTSHPRRLVPGTLMYAMLVALLSWLWVPQWAAAGRAAPPGVQSFEVVERYHVDTSVSYAQSPPVAGDHAPIWQNCGFYTAPITPENGVHSLEHGAVWITYTAPLTEDEEQHLRRLASRYSHVLVSPGAELPSQVVASAWNRQLQLSSANDPRLDQFVGAFHLGKQAPESGGPCSGGVGTPE